MERGGYAGKVRSVDYTSLRLCAQPAEPSVQSDGEKQPRSSRPNAGPIPRHRGYQPYQGGWGPQGVRLTGGGGPARVPNLRVCDHLLITGVARAGGEGRSNVLPWYRLVGVAEYLLKSQGREVPGCEDQVPRGGRSRPGPRTGRYLVSGRHVVRGRQPSPSCTPGYSEQARLVKTVKVQVVGCNLPWIRPSAPGCGDTSKAWASEVCLILGGDCPRRTASGSLSTGSPAGRSPSSAKEAAQCTVRPA